MSKINQCPFCKGENVTLKFKENKGTTKKSDWEFACTNCRYGIHGPIKECRDCHMIYVDDPITQHEITSFYETLNDPLYLMEQKAREKTFNAYLSKLIKFIPSKGKLLDVGTNTGLFVKLANDRGFKGVGLEPNKEAAQYAKETYGLKLVSAPFEGNTFAKESFDVVTMWDVIEHFVDPVSELKKVYNVLKPGGVYAFSTVDPSSFVARFWGTKWAWYMEMHRVFMDRPTMEAYLKKVGFNRVVFKPHFRYFSLGYTAKLWSSVHPIFSKIFTKLGEILGISGVLVPYYANDLYDCYAFKD